MSYSIKIHQQIINNVENQLIYYRVYMYATLAFDDL